jgi:hypothetical protein
MPSWRTICPLHTFSARRRVHRRPIQCAIRLGRVLNPTFNWHSSQDRAAPNSEVSFPTDALRYPVTFWSRSGAAGGRRHGNRLRILGTSKTGAGENGLRMVHISRACAVHWSDRPCLTKSSPVSILASESCGPTSSDRWQLACGCCHSPTHPRGLFGDETPVPGFYTGLNGVPRLAESLLNGFLPDNSIVDERHTPALCHLG